MANPRRGVDIGTPRWVRVSGLITLVLLLLFVILHLTGHGFAAHMHG